MLSKNQIKFVNSLKQKKFREEHQLFIAEGTKIVSELIESEIKIRQLFATPDFFQTHKSGFAFNHVIKCMMVHTVNSYIDFIL